MLTTLRVRVEKSRERVRNGVRTTDMERREEVIAPEQAEEFFRAFDVAGALGEWDEVYVRFFRVDPEE